MMAGGFLFSKITAQSCLKVCVRMPHLPLLSFSYWWARDGNNDLKIQINGIKKRTSEVQSGNYIKSHAILIHSFRLYLVLDLHIFTPQLSSRSYTDTWTHTAGTLTHRLYKTSTRITLCLLLRTWPPPACQHEIHTAPEGSPALICHHRLFTGFSSESSLKALKAKRLPHRASKSGPNRPTSLCKQCLCSFQLSNKYPESAGASGQI